MMERCSKNRAPWRTTAAMLPCGNWGSGACESEGTGRPTRVWQVDQWAGLAPLSAQAGVSGTRLPSASQFNPGLPGPYLIFSESSPLPEGTRFFPSAHPAPFQSDRLRHVRDRTDVPFRALIPIALCVPAPTGGGAPNSRPSVALIPCSDVPLSAPHRACRMRLTA